MTRRLAFVVNARTGGELKSGNLDASRVFAVLSRSDLGACDPDSPPPLHACPSSIDFLRAFKGLLARWKPEDQLVFYYSGHGHMRNNIYCLQLGTSDSDNEPFANILQLLKVAGVSRAVIIIDACHSGGALVEKGDSSSLSGILPSEGIPQGIAILVSSRIGEKSYELSDQSGSVFTKILCDGIESGLGGTPTNDGYISIADILDYISRTLHEEPYAKYQQNPMCKVSQSDRSIWIARNKTGPRQHPPAHTAVRNLDELRLAYETTVRSKHPCEGASVYDLDWKLIELYTEQSGDQPGLELPREDLLRRLGLFSPLSPSGQPTLHQAAVLCFCARPERYVPQARTAFIKGQTITQFPVAYIHGPLSLQVKQLIEKVKSEALTVFALDEGGLRRDELDLPMDVVREVISNAVVHRDYNASDTIRVWLMPDALEVRSPGAFPEGLSWEAFMSARQGSHPIDAAVALYVTNLLVFEGIGRGFEVIRQHISEHGNESIHFEFIDKPPTVVVRIARRPLVKQRTLPSSRPALATIDNSVTYVASSDAYPAVRSNVDHARPVPLYPSSEVEGLSKEIEAARARRTKLSDAGLPTDDVEREILRLRRQLREGGQLRAGDTLGDGRYLLIQPVGRGGFAVVWEAHDTVEKQRVAIKVLHANLSGDSHRRERLFRGARMMQRLDHPAVVRVLDPCCEDGGFWYFVMEFVTNGTLHDAVLTKRLSRDDALLQVIRVGEALAKAHAQGMVHRDIKPQNILLDEKLEAKLTDFDLVGAGDTTGGTRTSTMGTVIYAAPECLEKPQEATPRADVFGLGMTMIFGLSGKVLTLSTLRNPEPTIARLDCSEDVKDVLRRAVAWEPEQRFADAGAMIAKLRTAVEFTSARAR